MKWLDARRTHALIGPFEDDPVTRLFFACAFFMLAMFAVLTPAWLVDARLVEGVNVWTKPQKFHVSLFVHFVTLGLLAQTLPREVRAGPSLRIAGYLAVGALVMEAVYISVQAARGRRSHFNFDTPTESLFYAMMGVGALLLVGVAIVLGIQIWRKARTGAGLRAGAAAGLIIGGVLTIVLAGYMSSVVSGRWIGEHPAGGAAVPFFGWSREVGDLRPAHFIAMHMMQVTPLIGWLADRAGLGRMPALAAVGAAVIGQILLALLLFSTALGGKPFWPA